MLTGNSFLVADTLVETAPELFALVPADVVVTDVIERDVTHCKAQTTALIGRKYDGGGRGSSGRGGGESARLTDVSLLCCSSCKSLFATRMQIKISGQNNIKLITEHSAEASGDEDDKTSQQSHDRHTG